MIIVNFENNEEYKKAYGLWQYDYGQVLRIQGLDLPTAVEMHFSLTETGGEAVTRIGITKDGVTDVTIPDSLLEADGASQDYQIYVFIYLATPDSGETTRRITLGVKSRPRPEVFDTPGEEELFEGAVQAVNDAAKRAEEAGKEAIAAAGEARESASQAGKHLADTQALAEQVEINADTVAQGAEKAKELLDQTQEVASNAVISAQTAKQSETAAREAQTAAESAEDAARQYAAGTEADRQEVAENKQSVAQIQSNVARMQADVQADREAVEQTVSEFGQTAQDALTAIGQAQNTAVSAVTEEGQKQATTVQEAGAQAIDEIDTAKTAAVGAVASEGDKQVVRVQEAAAEIVSDREQIQHNKAYIATLTDKTNTLAPGIVLNAKGEAIAVHNASKQPLAGLTVYGQSTQAAKPSMDSPQEIVNAGADGSIEVEVTGGNLFPLIEDNIVKNTPLTVTINSDGSISISGTPSKRYESAFSTTQLMDFHPGTYYLGGGMFEKGKLIVQLNIVRNDDSIEYVSNKSFEFKKDDKKRSLLIQYSSAELIPVNQIIYPILVHGTENVPFEPYRTPQFLTLKTPDGLPGIPVKSGGNYTDSAGQQWVCDEIDLSRGVRIQRVLKTKPKIPITFANAEPNGRVSVWNDDIFGVGFKNASTPSLSTFAKYSEWANGNDGTFALSTNGIYYKDSTKTLEEINAMFAKLGTNLEVCGVLETPIETDLTPEEIAAYKSLHTYSPNTTITNDAGAEMAVEYVADTKTYIKSVEDKITAIQAALINQNISGGV